MKIAVSGKGGVGKTTLSSLLTGVLASRGRGVIALDADPDANLPSALGVPADEPITPIAEMDELIAERTGSKDNYGGYFKLNPKVDDIPEQFARRIGPIRLLVLGGVSQGGAGCICPASAVIKALLSHLVLGRDEAVIMDMEAGIEHLGRATAQSMDALLIVVDPGPWSVQTARRIRGLAAEIGLTKLFAVANRVTAPEDLDRIGSSLGDIPLIGHLPYDPALVGSSSITAADGRVRLSEACRGQGEAVEAILAKLEGSL
ncbi:MAG TPA: AAA family ATPase [Phycisphaerae bacterium]|nr:AAA family ATPase [Phycisphaerae bacterium]